MDWLLIVIGLVIGGFVSVTGFCAFLFARMGIRYWCGNDDDTLHKLHRRQHVLPTSTPDIPMPRVRPTLGPRVRTLIVDRGPIHGDVPFNSLRP